MTSSEFAAARRSLGIPQQVAALCLGMPQSSVSRIESGERAPTKVHSAALRSLVLLHKNNLLHILITEKKEARK